MSEPDSYQAQKFLLATQVGMMISMLGVPPTKENSKLLHAAMDRVFAAYIAAGKKGSPSQLAKDILADFIRHWPGQPLPDKGEQAFPE